MLRRMIVKEWKEKFRLVIFALAVFVLFLLAFSAYAKDPDALDYLSSTLVLIFPAVFALLLGASAFASEFQDGAWAYLFSRPVKKWKIWLAKYFSLLTVLYTVVLLLAFLIRFHPALKSASKSFNFTLTGNISYGFIIIVLPLLLFTTAFSLSFVSDKSYNVVFLAALIWLALQLALAMIIQPLFYRGVFRSPLCAISIVGVLLPLSFVLASLTTLNRADFSQSRSRAWVFTKSAAAGFLLLLVLTTLFIFGFGKLRTDLYLSYFKARDDAFYFATNKGIFKFDTADGQTEKIGRYPSMWGGMSLGGDKIVYATYHLGGKRSGFAEMRIMSSDGKNERSLLETWNPESPLYGAYIHPFCLPPRGDKVVFIARHMLKKESPELWVINSDGSGLKGYNLGIADAEYYRLISFGESGKTLFLLYTIKIKPGNRDQRIGANLLRVNLQSGNVETLAEKIRRPYVVSMAGESVASGTGLIAYLHIDEATQKEALTILNPETLEKRSVFLEDSVTWFHWSAAGDKLAFLTAGSKLGVYSVAELNVVKLAGLKGYDLRAPSQTLEWTQDGRLVLRRLDGTDSYICLLDAHLKEQKSIRLPFATYYPAWIWSAGKYVVVEDTERHQLWGVDLKTDKWARIY